MPTPIALQLYTLRNALARDFAGTIRRVAAMGYLGVETINVQGVAPDAAASLFEALDLRVPSAHLPLPAGKQAAEVIRTASALGCDRIVSTLGREFFSSLDRIRRTCELFNQAVEVAETNGFGFAVHNHWWEFQQVEGRAVYQVLLEELDPRVVFEIDIYWVKTAGHDPAAVLRQLGARAPLVHVKDGPAVQDAPMVAIGQGSLDIPAAIAAAEDAAEWLIVELDHCATDIFEAVERSYAYLVERGLARGRER
ncbi:MAG: xylose isomerase [Herpetosiphonaceae bacterium]|nr:MAG: xylose isomerase [Herpetosiphonaceae bacterium]